MLRDNSYIIAFDPGRTTGLVVAYYYNDGHFEIVRADEIRWRDRFEKTKKIVYEYAYNMVDTHSRACAIIIEDFKLRKDKAIEQAGDDMPSSQVIGIIEAYADLYGSLHLIKKQMPSVTSRVAILDRHVQLLGSSEHMKDAYKHIRYFIVSQLARGDRS